MGTNITNKGKERLPRNKSKNLHLKKVFSTLSASKAHGSTVNEMTTF